MSHKPTGLHGLLLGYKQLRQNTMRFGRPSRSFSPLACRHKYTCTELHSFNDIRNYMVRNGNYLQKGSVFNF
jgi:hypothetical protein